MIFWTTGRVFLPSRSCESKKSNVLREINANSRLMKEIDVNVARQMMFPQSCLVTWVIQPLDQELKMYPLWVFFYFKSVTIHWHFKRSFPQLVFTTTVLSDKLKESSFSTRMPHTGHFGPRRLHRSFDSPLASKAKVVTSECLLPHYWHTVAELSHQKHHHL